MKMNKNLIVLYLLLISFSSGCAQQTMSGYIGKWEGKLANKDALNLDISIKKLKGDDAVFKLSNDKEIVSEISI